MATVVLVHGAWCDGSSWSGVVAALQAAGREVVAVQNPLTSLAEDVAATTRVLDGVEGEVVLVGHSYGGAVISGASAGAADVRALVYVAAYAPDAGETVQGLGERFTATDGAATIRATADGWLTLDPDTFPEVFAGDVPRERARVLAAVQKPTHAACFGAPLAAAGWSRLPSTYIRSRGDRMVAPELQSWTADRIGATVHELDSSHASPVSRPEEIARIIGELL